MLGGVGESLRSPSAFLVFAVFDVQFLECCRYVYAVMFSTFISVRLCMVTSRIKCLRCFLLHATHVFIMPACFCEIFSQLLGVGLHDCNSANYS